MREEEEGLDESGMPPPPYDAGDKPPSISHVHVRRASEGESQVVGGVEDVDGADLERRENGAGIAVPLRTLDRNETQLRREFDALDDDVGDILRPSASQFGSERRLERGLGSGG